MADRDRISAPFSLATLDMNPSDHALPALLICMLTILIYASTLGHELVWDDLDLINRFESEGIANTLTTEFPTEGSGYYRPWIALNIGFDYLLSSSLPFIHHLANVILHSANAVLVFFLALRFLTDIRASLLAALLFAAHPANSESVSFVSGRTDLWAAMFTLIFIHLWLRRPNTSIDKRYWQLGLSLIAFTLGCLSKELLFFLPPVLIVWDYFLFGWSPWQNWLKRNFSWMFICGIGLVIVFSLRWGVAGAGFGQGLSSIAQAGKYQGFMEHPLIPSLFSFYFRILVFPINQSAYYTPDQIQIDWLSIASVLIITSLCSIVSGRRSNYLGLLALIWSVGFLIPVCGIIEIRGAIAAERFLYVPSIGIALAVGAAAQRLLQRRWGKVAVGLAATILISTASVASFERSQVWKDQLSLYEDTIQKSPKADLIRLNLGHAYIENERFAEGYELIGDVNMGIGMLPRAIEAYQLGLAAAPNSSALLKKVGIAYVDLERYTEGVSFLERAAHHGAGGADLDVNLGIAQLRTNNIPASIESLKKGLDKDETVVKAYRYLGYALTISGRHSEADTVYQRWLAVGKETALAHTEKGMAYLSRHQPDAAMNAFRAAIEADSKHAEAHLQIGLMFVRQGKRDTALHHYNTLLKLGSAKAKQLYRAYNELIENP